MVRQRSNSRFLQTLHTCLVDSAADNRLREPAKHAGIYRNPFEAAFLFVVLEYAGCQRVPGPPHLGNGPLFATYRVEQRRKLFGGGLASRLLCARQVGSRRKGRRVEPIGDESANAVDRKMLFDTRGGHGSQFGVFLVVEQNQRQLQCPIAPPSQGQPVDGFVLCDVGQLDDVVCIGEQMERIMPCARNRRVRCLDGHRPYSVGVTQQRQSSLARQNRSHYIVRTSAPASRSFRFNRRASIRSSVVCGFGARNCSTAVKSSLP